MDLDAPQVVIDYFAAKTVEDNEARVKCFAPYATVIDDGKEMKGTDEIREWCNKSASEYTYTTEVIGSEPIEVVGETTKYLVLARLEGNFPGSPVELKHRFDIRHGLIAELEIAP